MNKKTEDALKALAAGLAETPDDAGEVVKKLRSDLNEELYSPIFGAGVVNGKKEAVKAPEIKAKLEKLAELETENEQLKATAETLGDKTKGLEEVKAQHKRDMDALKSANKDALKAKDQQIKDKVREVAYAQVKGQFKGKVDELLVDSLADKVMKNAVVNDDLSVEFFDDKKVSIGNADDAAALQTIVKSGLKLVDPKFVKVANDAPPDRGQDLGNLLQNGGGGGGGDKKVMGVDLAAFQKNRDARVNPLVPPQTTPQAGRGGAGAAGG